MGSFFRNWHKPSSWYRTKKTPLSDTWFPKAQRHANTMTEVTFSDDRSKQITFVLDEEQTKHLIDQLTKIEQHEH